MCIADQVANDVGSIEPRLWVISGQKVDRAEPVLLISPVWIQTILALRSQDPQPPFFQSFGPNFHGGKTGSNPVGDAKRFQELTGNGHFWRRHKKAQVRRQFLARFA